ncbi:hypothetical protein [Haloquadratum walsbyi]|uniref:Transposase n=1 Tax=Haloquadratum walsbyi J07HQW2 TaxID=1238425 RepID=U1PME5_9EURY|nr:hypothetical protein [Haloquadratum walsbyi]ERG94892.1 MAG: hypothetical protein J07HQW2_01334 [Haloquadratum walsbyi J07HQW2]
MKTETTGDWYVSLSLSVEVEDKRVPEKTPAEELESDDCVGIDLGLAWLGVLNYLHTSDGDGDGVSVDGLDWTGLESRLADQYERLEREQRKLSRKQTRPVRPTGKNTEAEAEAGC